MAAWSSKYHRSYPFHQFCACFSSASRWRYEKHSNDIPTYSASSTKQGTRHFESGHILSFVWTHFGGNTKLRFFSSVLSVNLNFKTGDIDGLHGWTVKNYPFFWQLHYIIIFFGRLQTHHKIGKSSRCCLSKSDEKLPPKFSPNSDSERRWRTPHDSAQPQDVTKSTRQFK